MTEGKKGNFTHDNKKNATDVWVTPPWVFEGLGLEFDLDPATEQGGIPWIPATNIFTKDDDGLAQDWSEYGLIWCNPPYGTETGKFLKKMNFHRNGIALTFARTDNRWFFESAIKSDALLFLKGRIAFIDLKYVTKNQGGGAGSLFMAWGDKAVEGLKRLMFTMPDKCFFIDLRRDENKLDNPLLIGDLI